MSKKIQKSPSALKGFGFQVRKKSSLEINVDGSGGMAKRDGRRKLVGALRRLKNGTLINQIVKEKKSPSYISGTTKKYLMYEVVFLSGIIAGEVNSENALSTMERNLYAKYSVMTQKERKKQLEDLLLKIETKVPPLDL